MPNVVVYVKEADWKELEAAGEKPAEYVRDLVKQYFDKKRQKQSDRA